MKIERLELRAYGPFTGEVLDFSDGPAGLHIVYGPNEAGKSAALRALTALLFGIPARTRDNFIHDHRDLRLAASLRAADGSEFFFIRRKGNANTLLDASGKPLDDTLLDRFLPGLTAEIFASMFGIGHDELRRGGDELIEGKGRVAESLYAAALGVSGFREVLKGLDAEAEDIFKPAGRTVLLNGLITRHKDLRKEAADLLLQPKAWTAEKERQRSLEGELSRTVDALRDLRAEEAHLERLGKAIPVAGARKALLLELDGLAETVLLPPEFRERRIRAETDLENARAAERRAAQEIERIEEELEPLELEPALLSADKRVKALQLKLGSHQKAMTDEPGLRARRSQLLSDASTILKELAPGRGLDEAESFRVEAARRTRIQESGLEFQRITTERGKAEKEIRDLRGDLDDARKRLDGLDPPKDVSALARAIRKARKQGDLDGRLSDAEARVHETKKQVAAQVKALPLVQLAPEAVETLPVPLGESVERYDEEMRAVEADLTAARKRVEELVEREAGAEKLITALEREGAVPTEEDLLRAREHRERGWRLVRKTWLDGASDPGAVSAFTGERDLPSAYEASVRDADTVGDRLRREADRAARLASLTSERDDFRARRERAEAEAGRVEKALDAMRADWKALWNAAGITPLTPFEMRKWLTRHTKVVELLGQARREEAEAGRVREAIEAERAALSAELAALGEPEAAAGEAFSALVDRADEAKAKSETNAREREKLEERLDQAARRIEAAERTLASAETALAAWRENWGRAVSALGLDPDASPSEANAVLGKTQDLFTKVDEAGGLTARIEGIRRDAGDFDRETREVARAAAPDLDLPDAPASRIAEELQERLTRARMAAERERELRKQHRERQAALGKARTDRADAEERLQALKVLAGCESDEELVHAEARSERLREVRRALSDNTDRLASWSAGGGIEELVAEAGAADPDRIPVLLDEARRSIEERERERSRLDRELGAVRQKLDAMDGSARAAEAAQEAEGVLAKIRDRAEHYARLKLASVVLAREIERYREKNQGPILERASGIFGTLTLGSFTGLKPSFDAGDQPVLQGVRASGASVEVPFMSDGTRDQLYLALRLASLEKHLDGGEPVPFVLDDILINFDDARSAATLQVLHDLAARTQILFFTHHEHLLDLVARTPGITGFRVHRL